MTPRWDSYRYFLAIARAGSVAGASSMLGESVPTVSRRLTELEKGLGRQLFQRRSTGVDLTEDGQRVLHHAEQAERALLGAPFAVAEDAEEPSGQVRLTAPVALGRSVVAPALATLMQCHPKLEVELLLETRKLSVPNYEADIALRMGAPVHASLVGRKLGQITFGLFAHEDYIARHGAPSSFDDFGRQTIVVLKSLANPFPQTVALDQQLANVARRITTDDLVTQVDFVASGLGIGALPHYLASRHRGLVALSIDGFAVTVDLWLLARSDARTHRRLSVTQSCVSEAVKAALSDAQ
ncbi:MAG: LysR family transcriptional regulator [Pseudomonadota bacterium]